MIHEREPLVNTYISVPKGAASTAPTAGVRHCDCQSLHVARRPAQSAAARRLKAPGARLALHLSMPTRASFPALPSFCSPPACGRARGRVRACRQNMDNSIVPPLSPASCTASSTLVSHPAALAPPQVLLSSRVCGLPGELAHRILLLRLLYTDKAHLSPSTAQK